MYWVPCGSVWHSFFECLIIIIYCQLTCSQCKPPIKKYKMISELRILDFNIKSLEKNDFIMHQDKTEKLSVIGLRSYFSVFKKFGCLYELAFMQDSFLRKIYSLYLFFLQVMGGHLEIFMVHWISDTSGYLQSGIKQRKGNNYPQVTLPDVVSSQLQQGLGKHQKQNVCSPDFLLNQVLQSKYILSCSKAPT